MTSDQFYMIGDQFEKGDDQNWSQNLLVMGWSWHKTQFKNRIPKIPLEFDQFLALKLDIIGHTGT